MEMSKSRFTIILVSILVVIAVAVTVLVLTSRGLKAVDNEYLYTLSEEWEGTGEFSEGLAAVKTKDKWGYIDADGKLVVEAVYDGASTFSEGLAAVQKNGYWGFIDASGAVKIGFSFSAVTPFREGRSTYKEGNYYGYLNEKGERITEAVYGSATSFRDGVACVGNKTNTAYALIAPDGTLLTEYKFGETLRASESLLSFYYDDDALHSGYLTPDGKVSLEPKWFDAGDFSDGLAAVCTEYLAPYGYINMQGETVLEPQWIAADAFSHGYAAVRDAKGWYFINTKGEALTEKRYAAVYPFTEDGFARVCTLDGEKLLFGLIDATGKEVIAPRYAGAMDVHNGAMAVTNGTKWGYVSTDGTVLADYLWDDAGDFSAEGLARVRNKEYYGFVKLK